MGKVVLGNVLFLACLDISAAGFWSSHHQKAYFDVKVFNPNASSYRES